MAEATHFGFVLIGSSPSIRSSLAFLAQETLHLSIVTPSIINDYGQSVSSDSALQLFLNETSPQGFIFNNIPQTPEEARLLVKWSEKTGFELKVFSLIKEYPSSSEVFKILKTYTKIYTLETNNNFKELSRDFFQIISKFCFQDSKLAEKYFSFKDLCQRLKIPFIIISGACSYFYDGKRSLKDIDVVVPSRQDLRKLSRKTGVSIIESSSSCAKMYYLNLKEIDVNAEVKVFWDQSGKQVSFDFYDLLKDAKQIKFLGEECLVMSPEDLIIFKFALGRFGIDDFNDYKDDYEDIRGVIISQPVNWETLKKKAEKIGAWERVVFGKKLLGIK